MFFKKRGASALAARRPKKKQRLVGTNPATTSTSTIATGSDNDGVHDQINAKGCEE